MEERLCPEKQALISKLARLIVKREMSVPAILFLESVKPLSLVGSQLMHFLAPLVQCFFDFRSYELLAEMMEDRANVERLVDEIERQEEERKGKRAESK